MYNRTPFNRTAFNRSSVLVFEWTATVHAVAEATAKIALLLLLEGDTTATSEGAGAYIRVLLPSGLAEAEAKTAARLVRRLFMDGIAHALAEAEGTKVSIYELLTMVFEDINMKAGDLLFIDTKNMIATLNGVNIVDKIADGSTFFLLQPGENEVTVSDDGQVDVTILWKDRWL